MLRRFTAAATLALLPALAAAQAGDAAPPTFESLKPLVSEYFTAADDARPEILRKLEAAGMDSLALTKAQAEAVEKIALAGNTKVKIRTGDYVIDVDAGGTKLATHFHVPAGISGSKPAPLFVALHGGGPNSYDTAKTHAREMTGWLCKWSDAAGAILVVPSTSGDWGGEPGHTALWKSIEFACANYNVDPNRVYIYGGSMGGFGVCGAAVEKPDFFAVACPFIGCSDLSAHADNFSNLPFYIVIGENDMDFINKGARATAKKLEELGYDLTFREMKGKGHEVPPAEYPPLVAKLRKTARNMFAAKLRRGQGSGRWYWMECGGGAEGEVAGQTVTVKGGVSAVYLSDRMVNLDQPVKVVADGEVAFEGVAPRRLGVMMREIAETKDRGRVYTVRVEIR